MGSERVARVAVDMPLANLDRAFDYTVPDDLAGAVVGARVRVRFAGRLRNGFILELADESGRADLLPLHAVLSPEPVLVPEVARLVRTVADHYASTFSDVVRLAVPPRHATTEQAGSPEYPAPLLDAAGPSPLAGYPDGESYLGALTSGSSPRAAWTVAPRPGGVGDWAGGILDAAAATLRSRRGAVVVVPDATDLALVEELAAQRLGRGSFVTLTADLGPAARYRAFLAASRGRVRLVLGTRAAVFAPVADLGLVALWDDGDDSYAEPRAPYPHTREVAALRAHLAGAGLLLAARSRTAEVQRMVSTGWLRPVELAPVQTRAECAAIRVTADDESRLPREVFTTIRAGLAAGPVLVAVPRAGYHPVVLCAGCRDVARCPVCSQPLLNAPGGLTCRWCGPLARRWRCPTCGDTRVRTPVAGVVRTAEEFGRAFPGATVLHSTAEHRIAAVDERSAIVLATPGVEPTARFGYAAAVLLDTWATLRRPELRTGEEALRRWLAVAALVRPGEDGGTVLAVGETADRQVQALLRLDPVGYAERELAERAEAGFPPAVKLVTLEGEPGTLRDALSQLELPPEVTVHGPFELVGPGADAPARATLRSSLGAGPELVAGVRAMLAQRAARKAEGALRVRVDPQVVG